MSQIINIFFSKTLIPPQIYYVGDIIFCTNISSKLYNNKVAFTVRGRCSYTIIHPDCTLSNSGQSVYYMNKTVWENISTLFEYSNNYFSSLSYLDIANSISIENIIEKQQQQSIDLIVKLLDIKILTKFDGSKKYYFIIWDGSGDGTTQILSNRVEYSDEITMGRIESILITNESILESNPFIKKNIWIKLRNISINNNNNNSIHLEYTKSSSLLLFHNSNPIVEIKNKEIDELSKYYCKESERIKNLPYSIIKDNSKYDYNRTFILNEMIGRNISFTCKLICRVVSFSTELNESYFKMPIGKDIYFIVTDGIENMDICLKGVNLSCFFSIPYNIKQWNNKLVTKVKSDVLFLLKRMVNLEILCEYNGNKEKVVECINTRLIINN